MFKKKLTAIVTAALILGGSIPVLAQPQYVYLKSQTNDEVIYINYKDYVRGYASRNEQFMKTMKDYNITGISVKTPKGENVIDFNGYVEGYNKDGVKNVDDYCDKDGSKKATLPQKVKELHKDGTISSDQVTPPDNKKDDSTPISEARQKADEEIVTIKGVVTSVIGNNAFVQDETGGIYIYLGPTNNPNLVSGNQVKVTGPLNTYNNLKQISSPNPKENPNAVNITLESEKNNLPDAKATTVAGIKEEYQGTRVNIKNLTILFVSTPEKNGSYNVNVKDNTGSIVIRVDGNLEPKIDSSQFKVGSVIDITSCLSRFKTDLQLMINNINEIKVTSEGTGEVPSEKGVKINQVQGKAHVSPLKGQIVSEVRGIVTAISNDKFQNGFFMQSLPEDDDKDPATSEGIFVQDKGTKVKVGDEVAVDGVVDEVVNGLQEDCVPETVIKSNKVIVKSSGKSLPEAVVIKFNESLAKNIDDDNMKSFDIDKDAIDYYESLEGMRVEIKEPVIVGADERYGEICVLANNGEFSENQRTKYGGIKAYEDDFNPEVITIDDVIKPIVNNKTKSYIDPNFKVSVGDKFNNNIVGVMSSGFGKYKVFNVDKLPEITQGNYKNKEITSIVKDEKKLTVASFNVENLSKNDGDRMKKIANAIVTNLKSPDIIGLSEILDNNGINKSGGTDANETYEALIQDINVAGGPEYAWTDIAPVNGQDGGVPGGNIRVGFIYRKDKVTLANKQKGDATTAVNMTDTGLSVNPGRISPSDDCFKNSRKPLVAQFQYNGQDVFIIGNHLNSKRGDGSLFALNQPPVRISESQRHKQATLINNFVKEIVAKKPHANIIALGDMNDYEFSETISIIKGNEMRNAVDILPVNEKYSYVYNGNSQVLDNLLVSNNIYEKTEVDMVHINSQSTFEKLSDHDPILVQIDLGKAVELTDAESVAKTIKNINLGDVSKVTENLNLPKNGMHGTTIKWESNNSKVVSNTGVVTRPENGQGNANVKLTATVSKGKVQETKTFELTVLEKGKEQIPENPGDKEYLINEGFNSVTSDLKLNGWKIKANSKLYTSAGNYGKESPSLRLGSKSGETDCVITPAFKTEAKELSFWVKANGSGNTCELIVEGLVGDKWITIDKVVPSLKEGEIKTYKIEDKNVTQIKFSYEKSLNINIALDDIFIK